MEPQTIYDIIAEIEDDWKHGVCISMAGVSGLKEAFRAHREYEDRLEAENARLGAELAECRQTVEDVAIGQALECVTCGKFRPCMCDKGESANA